MEARLTNDPEIEVKTKLVGYWGQALLSWHVGIIWNAYWFAKTAILRSDHGGQAFNVERIFLIFLSPNGHFKGYAISHFEVKENRKIQICENWVSPLLWYWNIIINICTVLYCISGSFVSLASMVTSECCCFGMHPKWSPHANLEVPGLNNLLVFS